MNSYYAPYVIRDEAGYWHDYNLPTTGPGPYGVELIIYVSSDEVLDCKQLLAAIKPFLKPAPPGVWYKITVSERNIRKDRLVTAPVLMTLHKGNQVQVSEVVDGQNGKWGKVVSYKIGDVITSSNGYIFLASLSQA